MLMHQTPVAWCVCTTMQRRKPLSALLNALNAPATPHMSQEVKRCAEGGRVDELRVLLDGGADPNAQYEDGSVALHWACMKGASTCRHRPHHLRLLRPSGCGAPSADAQRHCRHGDERGVSECVP